MPTKQEKCDRTYKRGETRHSDCDCCMHAAERIDDLRQALIGGTQAVLAGRDMQSWALAVERLLREHVS